MKTATTETAEITPVAAPPITGTPPAVVQAGSMQITTDQSSLYDYLELIRGIVRQQVPSAWIRTEISQFKPHNGHAYLELVEHDAKGQVIAKIRGTIWKNTLSSLSKKFEDGAGCPLAADIKVLLHVRAEIHPQHGLSVIIGDIDPTYTLGDMEAKIAKIRANLQTQGLFDQNRMLPTPGEFTRVAVIAPEQAAGLGDFRREADILQAFGLCDFHYYHAAFQGASAPASIYDAMKKAWTDHLVRPVDAMVIIRGGGAKADLQWLNDERLAKAICRITIPVFTGIGHERDNTILDEIATRFDTPSKVSRHIADVITRNTMQAQQIAEWIKAQSGTIIEQALSGIERNQQAIQKATLAVLSNARQNASREESRLKESAILIQRALTSLTEMTGAIHVTTRATMDTQKRDIETQRFEIRARAQRLAQDARTSIEDGETTVRDMARREVRSELVHLDEQVRQLHEAAFQVLDRADREAGQLGMMIEAMHPAHVLRRGYAIVRSFDGAVRPTARSAIHEPRLYIAMSDGTITVTNEDFEQ